MTFKRVLTSISLSVSAVVIVSSPAFALTNAYLDKFANNDIIFYNPEECSETAQSSLSGSNIEEKILNYYLDHGFTESAAAGILGNAYAESGLQVARHGYSGDLFFGLFQYKKAYAKTLWKKMEDAGLLDIAENKKYDDSSENNNGYAVDKQVEQNMPGAIDKLLKIYLDYNLSTEDYRSDKWQKTINEWEGKEHAAEYAAEVFLAEVEKAVHDNGAELIYYKSNNKYQSAKRRRDAAKDYYEKYFGANGSGVSRTKSVSADYCCDPNSQLQTYSVYPSTKYTMGATEDEVNKNIAKVSSYIAGMKGITVSATSDSVKSAASYLVNHYEKQSGAVPGDTEKFIASLTGYSGMTDSFTNKTITDAVRSVLIDGKRILPGQVYDKVKPSDASNINNNGVAISSSDTSKFLRGITKMTVNNKTVVFWSWYDYSKNSGDALYYYESDPPSPSVLAASVGTSSNGRSSSHVTWKNGWVDSGIDGYVKDEVTSSTYSSLDSNFGSAFTSTSAKGSGTGANKITLLSTESSSTGDKASSLYKKSSGQSSPPHFTVDLFNKKTFQHGSINSAAAAVDGDADKYAGIQIAIVGFSNSSKSDDNYYLGSIDKLTVEHYKYLYTLVNAISIETGVPVSASVDWSSSSALSADNAKSYKGVLGRKHLQSSDTTNVPVQVWKQLSEAMTKVAEENNRVCPVNSTGDVAALQNLVKTIAHNEYSYDRGPSARKKEYVDLLKKGVWYSGGCSGNDCGGFVTTVMRESGWDDGYNPNKCGTYCDGRGQNWYLDNSDKWKNVTSEIRSDDDAMPGDVLISHGHTLMFVGDIPGFGSKLASASWSSDCSNSRPPMAEKKTSSIMWYINTGEYRVFRKIK
ncbi:hypothetical protein IKQ65_02790 [Candidatus Saccharibacteria bacterium]|nr:hypothetical protein [Candidatus Saccharibacteria bacterium]